MIVHLLEDAIDEIIPIQTTALRTMFSRSRFRAPESSIAPIAEYPISSPWKTIARAERRYKYPSVTAMSGWSHGDTITTVSGKDWTAEVIRIADIIGHALQPDKRRCTRSILRLPVVEADEGSEGRGCGKGVRVRMRGAVGEIAWASIGLQVLSGRRK